MFGEFRYATPPYKGVGGICWLDQDFQLTYNCLLSIF